MSETISFEVPDKGKIEVSLSDLALNQPDTVEGLFGLLNVKLTNPDGQLVYEGGVSIIPHGRGALNYPNGNLQYRGDWLDYKYNGYGQLFTENNIAQTKGYFKDHKKEGFCQVFDDEGKIQYAGEYLEESKSGTYFCEFHKNGYLKCMGKINLESGDFDPAFSYEFSDSGGVVRMPALPEDAKDAPENQIFVREESEFEKWGLVRLDRNELGIPITKIYSENLEQSEIRLPKYASTDPELGDLEILDAKYPKTLCNHDCVFYYGEDAKLKYSGNFVNGVWGGEGSLFDSDQNKIYEGKILDDKRDAEGVSYYASGKKRHEGLYKNDVYEVEGKEYHDESQLLLFEGTYENGVHKTGKKYYDIADEANEGASILEYEGDFNAEDQFECDAAKWYWPNSKLKYEGRFKAGNPHTENALIPTATKNPINPEEVDLVISKDRLGPKPEEEVQADAPAETPAEEGGEAPAEGEAQPEAEAEPEAEAQPEGESPPEGEAQPEGEAVVEVKIEDLRDTLVAHDDDHVDLEYEITLENFGKWYDEETGNLYYEGEFTDGEKTGWGKTFKEDANPKHHGLFKNGLPHGIHCKEYSDENKMVFKGQMSEGKYHERGAFYNPETGVMNYKGEFDEELVWNGQGTEFYENGKPKFNGKFDKKAYVDGQLWDMNGRQVFVGEFAAENVPNTGHVREFKKESEEAEEDYLAYDGKLVDQVYNGVGKKYHANSNINYDGDFVAGQFQGVGTLYSEEGKKKYWGDFTEDNTIGTDCKIHDHEGDEHLIFEGEMADGHYVKGTLCHDNGFKKYTGSFANDVYESEFGEQFSDVEEGRILFSGPYKEGGLCAEEGCKQYYDETDGPVLYEGGYSNGHYNGAGKCLHRNGMTKMEGAFVDHNITGEDGQYYYESGVLMYKGPIIDEKFTGEAVTLYTESGAIKYEGPMKDSEQHGETGKLYWATGDEQVLKYEGGFEEGKFSGENAVLYHENGKKAYEGNFVNGQESGENGKLFDEEERLIFEGNFDEGLKSGEGKEFNPEDGTVVFEGKFMGDVQAEGAVTRFAEDGKTKIFEGAVNGEGQKEGFGMEYFENGNKKFMGQFIADKYEHEATEEKKAVLWNEDGTKNYEGTFKQGMKSGEGVDLWCDPETNDETARYKGEFAEDKPHGTGIFYYHKSESTNNVLGCLDDNNEDPTAGICLKYEGPCEGGFMQGEKGVLFYNSGSISYEGPMKEDFQEGIGKSYFPSDKIKFEGPHKAGKFDGSEGKLYYQSGAVQYTGDFVADQFAGNGILFHENANKGYEGQFKENLPHGTGTMFDQEGNKKYHGELLNGKFDGLGTIFGDGDSPKYRGCFMQGKYHGAGQVYGPTGNILYVGGFKEGQIDTGDATIMYDNGNFKYKGPVAMGKYEGAGELYYNSGQLQYKGPFVNSKFEGENGIIYGVTGNKGYEGSFKAGNPHGNGIYYDTNGVKKYEGDFNMGLFNGVGKFYHDNGNVKYTGDWAMGKQHGEGEDFDKEGISVFKGIYKIGKPVKD